MAISAVSTVSAVVSSATNGTLTFTEPTGSAQGDYHVVTIALRGSKGYQTPSGWSLITEDLTGNTTANSAAGESGYQVFGCARGASAPTLSFTANTGGTADLALGRIRTYRGVKLSAPWRTFFGETQTAANTPFTTTNTLAVIQGEMLVQLVSGGRNTSFSVEQHNTGPTALSELGDTGSNLGADGTHVYSEWLATTSLVAASLSATPAATALHSMFVGVLQPAALVLPVTVQTYTVTGPTRTNKQQYSEQHQQTSVYGQSGVTVTADTDGVYDSLFETANNSQHQLWTAIANTASVRKTFSRSVKPGLRDKVRLGVTSGGSTVGSYVDFRLTGMGSIIAIYTNGGVTAGTAKIYLEADGAYRLEVSASNNATPQTFYGWMEPLIGEAQDANNNYLGSTASAALFIGKSQFEEPADFASDYIGPTTTAEVSSTTPYVKLIRGAATGYSPAVFTTQTYAATGQNVGMRVDRRLSVTTQTYSQTNQPVGMAFVRKINVVTASYTVSTVAVGLVAARKLPVSAQSYAVTTTAVGLAKGVVLPVSVANYAATGQDVTLRRALRLPVSVASYAVTGQTVGLAKGFKLPVAVVSYTATPQNMILRLGYSLAVTSASYTATANSVGMLRTLRLPVTTASVAVTGQAVNLLRGLKLPVSVSAYDVATQPVTLSRGFKLPVTAVSYATTGQDVAFKRGYAIAVTPVAYAATTLAVGFRRGLVLPVGPASVTVTTYNTGMLRANAYGLTCNTMQVVATGQNVGMAVSRRLSVAFLPLVVSAGATALGVARKLAVQPAALSLTGNNVAFTYNRSIAVACQSWAVTGGDVAFKAARVLPITPRSYAVTFAPVGTFIFTFKPVLRVWQIPVEDRYYHVAPEHRTHLIEAEDRTYRS